MLSDGSSGIRTSKEGLVLTVIVPGSTSGIGVWLCFGLMVLGAVGGIAVLLRSSGAGAYVGVALLLGGILVLMKAVGNFRGQEVITLGPEGLRISRVLGSTRYMSLADLNAFVRKHGDKLVHRDLPETEPSHEGSSLTNRFFLFATTAHSAAEHPPTNSYAKSFLRSLDTYKHSRGPLGGLLRRLFGRPWYPREIPLAIHAGPSQLVAVRRALSAHLEELKAQFEPSEAGNRDAVDARPRR
jgi:hypothetical protein